MLKPAGKQSSYQLTFLSTVEESSVLWCVTDFNNLSTSQQLHDEARCDDGRDTQLHESTSVGSEDDTNPVEGIS